jgi:hypothetical protein
MSSFDRRYEKIRLEDTQCLEATDYVVRSAEGPGYWRVNGFCSLIL